MYLRGFDSFICDMINYVGKKLRKKIKRSKETGSKTEKFPRELGC